MSQIFWISLTSLLLTIVMGAFGAGGFYWLTKNHVKHLQDSMDRMEKRMEVVEQNIALIKGALGIGIK